MKNGKTTYKQNKSGQGVLREATEELEKRVAERTAKLSLAVSSLEEEIRQRKQAEDEIRESQQALRNLAAELQVVEEKERHRIAKDLHDSICQILAFSGTALKIMHKSLPEKEAKTVQEVVKQLDIAVKQARALSFDLSPSTLYDLGFEAAVEELTEKMSERGKIKCKFENCNMPKPLAEDVKILLYRSVRELIVNAAKHAKADSVKVSLSRNGSKIYVTVEDDGRGILCDDSKRTKGFGLFSIRERLQHIGGQLKIDSAAGKRTKAVLTAPLDINNKNGRIEL